MGVPKDATPSADSRARAEDRVAAFVDGLDFADQATCYRLLRVKGWTDEKALQTLLRVYRR